MERRRNGSLHSGSDDSGMASKPGNRRRGTARIAQVHPEWQIRMKVARPPTSVHRTGSCLNLAAMVPELRTSSGVANIQRALSIVT
jgi:hypothetical protein